LRLMACLIRCVLYEMVHGKRPFRSVDMGSLINMIKKCKITFDDECCSATLQDLLHKLMTVDPSARLGSANLGNCH
jgi:serine/threonine protein kinase